MLEAIHQVSTTQPGGYRDVAPSDVSRLGFPGRIIDVREPHEFTGELGHMPKAELCPLGSIDQAAKTWDRSQPLLMVCRSGGRSGRAAQQLASMGFQTVYNMAGGMLAYGAAGLPTER